MHNVSAIRYLTSEVIFQIKEILENKTQKLKENLMFKNKSTKNVQVSILFCSLKPLLSFPIDN